VGLFALLLKAIFFSPIKYLFLFVHVLYSQLLLKQLRLFSPKTVESGAERKLIAEANFRISPTEERGQSIDNER
jgi:hypothetical protein